MHSLRNKLLCLVFGSMFALFAIISFVSYTLLSKTVWEDFDQTVSIISEEKAFSLNSDFNRIEEGVEELRDYILEKVDTEKLRTNSPYNNIFYAELAVKCRDVAQLAGDVVAVYFRPDPTVYGSTSGVFLTDDGTKKYVNVEPTDILKYTKSEREFVGWYYEPIESTEPMWVKPYHNNNINVYMMSYVIPLYINGKLLGVVGMDIRMSLVTSILDSVDYKKGFAFLFSSDGDIVYQRDYPEGLSVNRFNSDMRQVAKYLNPIARNKGQIGQYSWKNEEHRVLARKLDNGMTLMISVPEKEIVRHIRSMIFQTAILFMALLIGVFLIFWRLMVVIITPIRELTRASSRITKGELNTPINYDSSDEIGDLAQSIRKMAQEIKEYFAYIHSQAYTDAMTGVGNKTAYMDQVKLIERKISEGMAAFMVVVFDVNGLKTVNDNLGHEYGDMLIKDSADIMKRVFSTENVFRIGGDEFIVVIENEGETEIADYFKNFDAEVLAFNENNTRYENKLAISKGGVAYEPELDESYKDVFKRADSMMYKDKEAFYRGKNDRRRR